MPDYPGYGMSGGTPSERSLHATADAAYDFLLTRPEIDPQHIAAVGQSLGAAVAVDLAVRRPVFRLVTISAFTSLPAVACPILLIHGRADTLVPFTMSEELLSLPTRQPIRRCELPGAGHNDIFSVGGEALWAEIGRFLATDPKAHGSAWRQAFPPARFVREP